MSPAEHEYGPIFGEAHGLPRGPHELSREEVAESQRTRILIAMTELVGEHGYAAVTVAQVARSAGVSPRTFYNHFDDKLGCFLTAYDHFTDVLSERLEAALASEDGLDGVIDVTLRAYLATLQADPVAARAFHIEGPVAGQAVRQRRRAADRQLADRVRARHRDLCAREPDLEELPDMAYRALVYAVRELTCEVLDDPSPEPLALAGELRDWLGGTLRASGG